MSATQEIAAGYVTVGGAVDRESAYERMAKKAADTTKPPNSQRLRYSVKLVCSSVLSGITSSPTTRAMLILSLIHI